VVGSHTPHVATTDSAGGEGNYIVLNPVVLMEIFRCFYFDHSRNQPIYYQYSDHYPPWYAPDECVTLAMLILLSVTRSVNSSLAYSTVDCY
jgi:hypothetical protein